MPSKFPQNFPCQDSVRQADYLEIFESGEDLLAKTLRFSWLHWLGCPRSPNKVPPKKKTFVVIVMFVVTGVSRVPTLRQRWETLSQQPRCQRLGLLEAGKFWIFLGV